ncbi:MAG: FecR domain-containing protein, partial [Elusimicrobia bacterium]|nr:FecR domain-containing protein [Elusimicrobiota bacterium]
MKKLLFFLVLAVPAQVFGQGASVTAVGGQVSYRINSAAAWQPLSVGTEIQEGSSIRTGRDGRAVLKYPNKSTLWLKENTSLLVEERQNLKNTVSMEIGSVKARVPHLKRKEYFHVRTGRAVAAVRGTVFTVDRLTEESQPIIQVLFGEVNLNLYSDANVLES